MEDESALEVVRTLAEGIDPVSGEVLGPEDPCQHPRVIRALYAAGGALERELVRRRRRSRLPDNAGNPWSPEEDLLLERGLAEGRTVAELAKGHMRTTAAIEARLARLGHGEPGALPPPAGGPV